MTERIDPSQGPSVNLGVQPLNQADHDTVSLTRSLTRSARSLRDPSRLPLLARFAALTGLGAAAIFVACGSGTEGSVDNPPQSNPNGEANPTATLAIDATDTPVPATNTPEPTATPESQVLVVEQLKGLVEDAVATLPESSVTRTIELGIQTVVDQVNAKDPDLSVQSPINIAGNAAQDLADLACANPDNDKLGEAWLAIRNFTEVFSQQNEANGNLPEGATAIFLDNLFKVPEGCEHPLLVSK